MRDLAKFKKAKVSLAGALGLLLALGLLVTLITPVSAVPQPSHRFWGTVSISGELAPEGTEVVATIEGVAEEFSTVVDANHHYGYDPIFYVEADDPDTPAKEGGTTGDTIEFYVADTLATTFTFEVGGSDALDLTVGVPGALVADAGGPYTGTVDESVSLSGSATGGTPPYSYAWDLDDDGYYDDSTARNPSYTWDAAGDYTVGLEVTDDVGETDTDTASVSISPPGALVADAGGPYTGTVDESVSLSGSATGGISPYSYAWDLDDDGAYDDSYIQNPSYTWDAAGDYTVGLKVTDAASDTDTDTASVDIGAVAPPTPGVGGTAYLPDKLAILWPWIAALAVVLAGGISWLALRRRRA